MFKLIKFEFARKKMVFAVAAALTVLGQLYALYNYFKIDETIRGGIGDDVFAIFIGVVLVAFAILYFIDIIFLFRNDLFKQEGYMLFMTPHNGYKLLGAKLIFALIEGLCIALIYMALVYFNAQIMHMGPIDFDLTGINGEMIRTMIKGLILGVFGILEFALTVYLSFALFKSLFNNTRFKGLITFGIFVLINIVKSKIVSVIADLMGQTFSTVAINSSDMMLETVNTALNYGLAASIVSAVILFIGTGYLLENRINL